MVGRLPDTRRIRVVTTRLGEFGDLDGESPEKQRRGSPQGARLLRRDVRDWDTRNLWIETQVAEVQRESLG